MKTTAFTKYHIANGAKMAEFAGYNMPIEFSGINDEHATVREKAGVFDVSHMGEIWVKGEKALPFLQHITTNDVSKLYDGKVQYSCMPNGKGGIVDDILVYRINEVTYLLCVNAANIDKDWEHIQREGKAFGLEAGHGKELYNASDEICQLAVQGPLAMKIVQKMCDEQVEDMEYYTFRKMQVAGCDAILSITGYTGSGGCEIYVANEDADKLWEALWAAGEEYGLKNIGLGARDTLRLEKGFCLYGNDIDDTTSPLEAGLGWVTKFAEGKEFIDREFLAKQTPGFAGADIANVCNEAALIAARNDHKVVMQEDFLAAIDRIVGGLERRNMPMTAAERRSTAIHEVGHAVVMWRLQNCDPVLKVTIIPRGRSLGATWYLPEERVNHNIEHFMHKMAGLLGGRIAEQELLNVTSTGAISDLERTSKTAYAMVAYYGMSPKVGNISYYDTTGQRDMFTKPFSEQTAQMIDEEVRRIVDEVVVMTREIINAERENIERIADILLEKETIFSEDIEAVLGKSAQQVAKEALEAETPKAETEATAEGANTELKYVIEPAVEDTTDKAE